MPAFPWHPTLGKDVKDGRIEIKQRYKKDRD